MIRFKDGRILEISNNSGHFKPTNSALQQAETIFKQKMPTNLLDDVVFEGQPVITIGGKDYIKTNGVFVEYAPGKYGGTSSFFPQNWSEARILDEVEYAVANNHGKIPGTNNTYFGFSKNGKVEIHFYLNNDGTIGSYFPKKK